MAIFRFLFVSFLLALFTSSVFAQSPYVFTPTGGDDAAGLRAALMANRWVQINGTDIRIDTPIDLVTESGAPLHNVLVEPAPGIKQTTVHSTIPQDAIVPSNPSRAPFNYNGGFEPGSFLTTSVPAGVMSITIRDPQQLIWRTATDVRKPRPFQVGDYIYLNDTSRVPDVTAGYVTPVLDGAVEVRQILLVEPSGKAGELRLFLESPLRRPHKATVAVAHCEPIKNSVFRNLRFTSDNQPGPRVGIHIHTAFNAHISNVTSVNWRGFCLVLIDTGGHNNTIKNCYATGVNTATDRPNGWGIAMEGQEGSVILDSGAERHSQGIIMNYSIDTFAINSSVQGCSHGSLMVWNDLEGNPAIRSGFIGGRVVGGGLGASVGVNCVECVVNVNIEGSYSGVKVGLGAYNTRIMGSILGWTSYGVGIDSINGGVSDGAVSSQGTLLNTTAKCANTKLALLNGTGVYPHTPSTTDGYYTLAPLFNACQ